MGGGAMLVVEPGVDDVLGPASEASAPVVVAASSEPVDAEHAATANIETTTPSARPPVRGPRSRQASAVRRSVAIARRREIVEASEPE